MLYGTVNVFGGMDIESTSGLVANIEKFVGKTIALPGNVWLPVGTRIKAKLIIEDKRPYVVDYTEIFDA